MSSAIRRFSAVLAAAILVTLGMSAPAMASMPARAPQPASASVRADDPGPGLATFGISPASATAPDGRSYVIIGAAPGAVVTDNIAIVNQSDFSLPLAVYPSEATNADDGTLTLANRGDLSDAGTWLTLGTDRVDVPAQSSAGIGFVVVPITVKIPSDAEPGDHVAAVMASLTTTGQGGANSPNINLEQRVGARVYITVVGAVEPGLAVTGLLTSYDPGPLWGLLGQGKMTVVYTLKNTGNVRVAVKARAATAGPFGLLSRSADGTQVDELLPRASVSQTVVLDHVWPLMRTEASVLAAVGVAAGAVDTKLAPSSAAESVWTVPWLWLAVLLLVVLVLVRKPLLRLWRRLPQRPRRPRGSHAAHDAGRGGEQGAAQPSAPTDGETESAQEVVARTPV
ncbi:MAG: hypothetical protein KJ792_07740 [Actinobacteria bacterium]|nr:hypothetical protein [Actinomycetota bacterium]MCG2801161.1 hypothetical protein [Cellulomonas sp.]